MYNKQSFLAPFSAAVGGERSSLSLFLPSPSFRKSEDNDPQNK
jgi:hypothetical protein